MLHKRPLFQTRHYSKLSPIFLRASNSTIAFTSRRREVVRLAKHFSHCFGMDNYNFYADQWMQDCLGDDWKEQVDAV